MLSLRANMVHNVKNTWIFDINHVRIFFARSHKMGQNFCLSSVQRQNWRQTCWKANKSEMLNSPHQTRELWSCGSGIEKAPETADDRYCWTGALHVVYQRWSLNVRLSGSTSGSARLRTYSRYIPGFRV